MPHTKLIVGLGNPGKQYEKTRHNVGFMILDALHTHLKSEGINNWELSKKFNAEISGCTIRGEKIILAKPLTFMNRSGETVGLIGQFYKLTHKDLIVVHDDKDIPLGEIKIQQDRGHAGHNGIKSIMEILGTKDFVRVRIGIASENKKKMEDTASFVLKKFGVFEKKKLELMIGKAVEEITALVH
jgi:PTH1 family peptidyl-tRNA hydrolase